MSASPKLTLIFVIVLTLLSASPASAATDDEWTFQGGGWGHGVGLSQFGALGQAQEGRKAGEILSHYYTGTSVASPLPADHWILQPEALAVGLAPDTISVDLAAVGGAVTACQPSSDCSQVNEPINPDESWKFEIKGDEPDKCRFRRGTGEDGWNGGWGPCDAEVRQDPSTSIRIELNGKEYAHGTVRFKPSESGFHGVLMIGLELYLRGLAEVPSSWPAEVLRAQGIIGRSYAVVTAIERDGKPFWEDLCGCHLRATSSDQVYAGWSKEDPANGGDNWKAAVEDTKGQLLVHKDSNYPYDIAKAFYSSSNGGASEDVEDVWGGSALPWLRSIDDPWSSDPDVNPLARWSVLVTSSDLATALGWDTVSKAEVMTGPPGVVVKFSGKAGGSAVSKDLNGTQVASILRTYGYGYKASGSTNTSVRVSPYIISVKLLLPFVDISDSIFKDAIVWLFDQGVTKGCNPPTNDHYCPNDDVTRGEMAVFLARALELGAASKDYFTDDDGKFYENAANMIAEAGITKGCGGTKFCGDRDVTRGEMAAFLARAFGLPVTDADYFVDDEDSIFEGAINRIAEAGITLGCNPPTNDRYCPSDDVTRGQMAAFFKRGLTG